MTNHNDHLKANCEKCFGLCCVALPFAASVDFAVNKDGGKPCSNLQSDFKCSIHKNLRGKGYKGCTVFECFGAGQKISQVTFNGVDWRKDAKHARKMYDAFPVMHQLHEMLWYLNEAILLKATQPIHKELETAIEETERLSNLNPDELMKINVPMHRAEVNILLLETSELVWKEMNTARKKRIIHRGADLMGANLKKKDLQQNKNICLCCETFVLFDARVMLIIRNYGKFRKWAWHQRIFTWPTLSRYFCLDKKCVKCTSREIKKFSHSEKIF